MAKKRTAKKRKAQKKSASSSRAGQPSVPTPSAKLLAGLAQPKSVTAGVRNAGKRLLDYARRVSSDSGQLARLAVAVVEARMKCSGQGDMASGEACQLIAGLLTEGGSCADPHRAASAGLARAVEEHWVEQDNGCLGLSYDGLAVARRLTPASLSGAWSAAAGASVAQGKARISKGEARGKLLDLIDRGEPFTTRDDLATRIGCAAGTISKLLQEDPRLGAWRARSQGITLPLPPSPEDAFAVQEDAFFDALTRESHSAIKDVRTLRSRDDRRALIQKITRMDEGAWREFIGEGRPEAEKVDIVIEVLTSRTLHGRRRERDQITRESELADKMQRLRELADDPTLDLEDREEAEAEAERLRSGMSLPPPDVTES